MDTGERKKRKKDGDAEAALFEDGEEENEDVKMEKFYALIRSIRDVKERLSNMAARPTTGNHNVDHRKKALSIGTKPPPPPPLPSVSVWCPTFQPEDFMEDRPPEPPKPDHHVESSNTRPPHPPPPDLNININPNTHEGKEEALAAGGGRNKTEEDRDDDDDHALDLKLSL